MISSINNISLGNLVYCPNGKPGIVAKIITGVTGKVFVIEATDEFMPTVIRYNVNEISLVPEAEPNEMFERWFHFYNIAQINFHKYKSKDSIQKAREGLVLRTRTFQRKGKTVTRKQWVREGSFKKLEKLKKQAGIKPTISGKSAKWKAQLTPDKETFEKIQAGDANVLADYVMKTYWQPREEGGFAVKNITKSFMRVRMESFDHEDIAQDAALRALELQHRGKFQEISDINKMPSYMAMIFKNAARETSRKMVFGARSKYYQEKEIVGTTLVDDFVKLENMMKEPERTTSQVAAEKLAKISQVINEFQRHLKARPKAILDKVIAGISHEKIAIEMGTTVAATKNIMKRQYGILKFQLSNAGIQSPNNVSGITRLLRQILRGKAPQIEKISKFGKAFIGNIRLKNGRLILKAKEGGEYKRKMKLGGKFIYDYGPDDKRTHPYFKKKYQTEDTEGKEKLKQRKKEQTELKGGRRQKIKDAIKSSIKGMINVMTEVFSGGGGTVTAGAEGEKKGAEIKDISEAFKRRANEKRDVGIDKPEDKPKKKPKGEPKDKPIWFP